MRTFATDPSHTATPYATGTYYPQSAHLSPTTPNTTRAYIRTRAPHKIIPVCLSTTSVCPPKDYTTNSLINEQAAFSLLRRAACDREEPDLLPVEHGELLVAHEDHPPHERREPDGRVLVGVVFSNHDRVWHREKPGKKRMSMQATERSIVVRLCVCVGGGNEDVPAYAAARLALSFRALPANCVCHELAGQDGEVAIGFASPQASRSRATKTN